MVQKKSGIYRIRNTKNGKIYIGSAVNLRNRWNLHRQGLRRGTHANRHLQSSWNKNGETHFLFEVIKLVPDPKQLLVEEQQILDAYLAQKVVLYNICLIARSCLGVTRSKETREKMSKALKGRVISKEHREKLRNANLGKKATAATRKKMSAAKIGIKKGPYNCKKKTEYWTLNCAFCGTSFMRKARLERHRVKKKKGGPFCGTPCRNRQLAENRKNGHFGVRPRL